MAANILRIVSAAILCWIAGRKLMELTRGLSPGDRVRVRIAVTLLIVAGLIFPAP